MHLLYFLFFNKQHILTDKMTFILQHSVKMHLLYFLFFNKQHILTDKMTFKLQK